MATKFEYSDLLEENEVLRNRVKELENTLGFKKKNFLLSFDLMQRIDAYSLNTHLKWFSFQKSSEPMFLIANGYLSIKRDNFNYVLTIDYDQRGDECSTLKIEGPQDLIKMVLENMQFEIED